MAYNQYGAQGGYNPPPGNPYAPPPQAYPTQASYPAPGYPQPPTQPGFGHNAYGPLGGAPPHAQQAFGPPSYPAATPQYGHYNQPPVAVGLSHPPVPMSQATPYGNPQVQPTGPWYNGTPLAWDPLITTVAPPNPLPGYDPSLDVEGIYRACKGFGTDEKALHRILCPKSAAHMQVIVDQYKAKKGKDLDEVIKKETSRWHETTLRALVAGPLFGDADLLHNALAGLGTKETTLTELIIGRSASDIQMLRLAYQKKYHKSMDQMVLDDLSLKTKDAFAIALRAQWTDNGYVDPTLLHNDVEHLKMYMRFGATDEIAVASIIFARSPTYMQALCASFRQRHSVSLTSQIKKHFSFHLKDALLYAIEGGKKDGKGIWRDAKMLEVAMTGAGTKDHQLIYRIVRAHWDRPRFEQVKQAYMTKYRKPLVARVRSETSGHYEDALVSIIEGR